MCIVPQLLTKAASDGGSRLWGIYRFFSRRRCQRRVAKRDDRTENSVIVDAMRMRACEVVVFVLWKEPM